jgi:hypothetical protein
VSAGTQYARDLGKLKGVLKIIFGKLFVRGTMRRLKIKFSLGAAVGLDGQKAGPARCGATTKGVQAWMRCAGQELPECLKGFQ